VGEYTLEGITKDGQPIKFYIEEQERSEIEKVKSQDIRQNSAGVGYAPGKSKFQNISGSKTERRDYIPVKQISEEVASKVNFLLKYKGEKAIGEYLNLIKETQSGAIETALNEAKDALKILLQKEIEIQHEKSKYEALVKSLQEALNIQLGKFSPLAPGSQELKAKAKRGTRRQQIKDILLSGQKSKATLQSLLVDLGMTKGAAYQLIFASEKAGVIEENEGMYSWIGN